MYICMLYVFQHDVVLTELQSTALIISYCLHFVLHRYLSWTSVLLLTNDYSCWVKGEAQTCP